MCIRDSLDPDQQARPSGPHGYNVGQLGARRKRPVLQRKTPGRPEEVSDYQAISVVKRRIGGAREDRTPDLLNAIQALSHLSYDPEPSARCWAHRGRLAAVFRGCLLYTSRCV